MPKPTKRPKRIKVGYENLEIVEDGERLIESEAGGMFAPNSARIYVEPRQDYDYAKMALLHEVLHCCLHASGADTDKTIEEHYISVMSPVLLQVLRDNPHLVAFLTQKPC